jgi:Ribbon-helix-helix protein, copG family
MPGVRATAGGKAPVHPRREGHNMLCDDRLEVRIPSDEKSVVEERAREEGVSVSTIIRRAIRAITGQRPPLTLEQAQHMVLLRRHLNAIEDGLNRLGLSAAELAPVRSDLARARRGVQSLLGR